MPLRLFRRLNEPPIVNRIAFELWLLVFSFLVGSILIFTEEAPGSIDSLLPPFFLWVWSITLVIGPLVIAYSLTAKNRLQGLLLEFWTLIPYGLVWLLYGGAVAWVAGKQGLIAVGLACTACASCWTTSYLIRHELRRLGLWHGLGNNNR